jgi:hypothetical protein
MLIPFGCCEMTITPIIHLKQVFYKALYYILVFYSKIANEHEFISSFYFYVFLVYQSV